MRNIKFFSTIALLIIVTNTSTTKPTTFNPNLDDEMIVSKCCTLEYLNSSLRVNCSNLNWISVNPLCLPADAEILLLDYNNLAILTNGSFKNLTNLRHLSITSSNVTYIEPDAFLGLNNLHSLNLESNLLTDQTPTFDPVIFRHLSNLKELFIAKNKINFKTNASLNESFTYLPNLTTFSLDGAQNMNIGSEFSNLSQLQNLTVYCSAVTKVSNTSFQGLWNSSLKVLNLVNFEKMAFDPDYDEPNSEMLFSDDAFQNLNSLEVLKMYNCKIGNQNMAKKFKHFVNSSLHTVHLETTHFKRDFNPPHSSFLDGLIVSSTLEYLGQINLTHLSWIDSDIFAVAPAVIGTVPWRHHMKRLDFSKNNFGYLGWRVPLLEISRLQKLEEIIVTSPYVPNDITYPALKYQNLMPLSDSGHVFGQLKLSMTDHRSQSLEEHKTNQNAELRNPLGEIPRVSFRDKEVEEMTITSDSQLTGFLDQQSSHGYSDKPPFPFNSGTWTIRMPPCLRKLRMVYAFTLATNFGNQSVRFTQSRWEAANMTHLYFIGNGFVQGTGRVMGLTKLQLLDFSDGAFYVEHYFFDDFPSLKYLILKYIKNKDFFHRVPIDRMIHNLPDLEYLDLTGNKLNFLPAKLFSRNPQISHVILSKNRFSSIPLKVSLVTSLRVLDISGNAVVYLNDEEMTSLTHHAKIASPFLLALAENNIACVCSQINFLAWINASDYLDKKGNYSCTSENGQLINTDILLEDLQAFTRQCYGFNYFLMSLVLILLMSFTFLAAYIVHRFRNAIEAYLVRIFARAFRPMRSSDYRTHVFIGYADDDVGFVRNVLLPFLEKDLRVITFIHHRDMGPGYTDQQLFEAIRDSWRILLVVTENFLTRYDMSNIVMKYASHPVTPANQGRVIAMAHRPQLYSIPDYLYDVLEDSGIIVLEDMASELVYTQRQKVIECLRDPQ